MSQTGTPPTKDEKRAPTNSFSTPFYVPMIPMLFPYANPNATAQQYYPPGIFPNVSAYPSTGNHQHGNYGVNYGSIYPSPYFTIRNNVLSTIPPVSNSSALIPPRPMMPTTSSLPLYHSSITTNDTERNKNLNIRECQSPVIDQTKKPKKPLRIVDPNDLNSQVRIRKDSSSTSSPTSQPESNHISGPSTCSIQEIDSDTVQDDFLTFIEQKTKSATSMPELNPFANEFSLAKNQTLTNNLPVSTSVNNHLETTHENHSAYRLSFDNLIERSLESIEAIKKSTKKISVQDASVQCDPVNDLVNRSTQTINDTANSDLLNDYSQRTIQSMNTLLGNFRNIYQHELHTELQTMAQTCDELRQLVLFLHHITSADHGRPSTSSINVDNPFSSLIQDLANGITTPDTYQKSSQMTDSAGRVAYRLIKSTSHSPIPSFLSRHIDPITRDKFQTICLLCRKPLDENDDLMHKLCRSLSFPSSMPTDT